MNHQNNLNFAIAGAFHHVLSCESTVAEIAPLVSREQAEVLADLRDWCAEVLAARPAIKPATEWRTPTEVRRGVAERIKANNERGITRRRGRAVGR